jgi:phosphoribosylformylglycinamidine (FGAM) synthase-like enzyme
LYNETGGVPIPPTPVVGCVGLVHNVTRIPDRWQPGDRVYLLRGSGAELVRFVWRNAPAFTLAHDVSDGGLALALSEAGVWSRVDPPAAAGADVPALGVVVAVHAAAGAPAWDDLVELGAV